MSGDSKNDSVTKLIIGTMEMGKRADQTMSEEMCKHFVSKGFTETDTAIMYAGGETERVLGRFNEDLTKQLVISTKVNPLTGPMTKAAVLEQANQSLTSLKAKSVDILYLHMPDHVTPIQDTLSAIDQLHKEGKFQRFGLSNYASWQVAEIYYLCKEKGYVLPSVYQGMYNVITRNVEGELFPCLKRLGLAFYAYNPLAGGILTNKYKFEEESELKEGRFAGPEKWAEAYRKRFWNSNNFQAVKLMNDALAEAYAGEEPPTLAAACLRWMMHHSAMAGSRGDGLIVGASSMQHLVPNMAAAAQGPLKQAVVDAMDAAWELTKATSVVYYR